MTVMLTIVMNWWYLCKQRLWRWVRLHCHDIIVEVCSSNSHTHYRPSFNYLPATVYDIRWATFKSRWRRRFRSVNCGSRSANGREQWCHIQRGSIRRPPTDIPRLLRPTRRHSASFIAALRLLLHFRMTATQTSPTALVHTCQKGSEISQTWTSCRHTEWRRHLDIRK